MVKMAAADLTKRGLRDGGGDARQGPSRVKRPERRAFTNAWTYEGTEQRSEPTRASPIELLQRNRVVI